MGEDISISTNPLVHNWANALRQCRLIIDYFRCLTASYIAWWLSSQIAGEFNAISVAPLASAV